MVTRDPRIDEYIAQAPPFAKPILTRIRKADRFESIADVPSEAALVKLVKEAVALNESGVKVPRAKKAPKTLLSAPTYMLAAIKKNKRAHAAYDAFSPSCKGEYIEWIIEAKTDETRDRRLATAIAWMAEGKVRNWKYVG